MYIFILLHQTTTFILIVCSVMWLYIFILLHQTTTYRNLIQLRKSCISLYSYIKPQLRERLSGGALRCISLYSYIKPQLIPGFYIKTAVVYLYTPTSNHNTKLVAPLTLLLYIFILLHQTTTQQLNSLVTIRCISLYSYIKPQLITLMVVDVGVVYLYTPTSNHNWQP